MANIINPFPQAGGVERPVHNTRAAERSTEKFTDHLDRRLDTAQRRGQDQLGVRDREAAQSDQAERLDKSVDKGTEKRSDIEQLIFFLQDIQQVARQKNMQPGEWGVELPEGEILADLAEQAGMNKADLNALVEQFTSKNGELDMDAFFQALINHFVAFEENPAIVVPETEFPLLESLLTKMGLSPEQLQSISDQAVVGDGDIDLALIAQALKDLSVSPENLQNVPLSDWEAEQLQGLLDKAGISLGGQLEILPEQLFGEEMVLSYDRLQALLQEGVDLARANEPQLDLVKFLGSLEKVMRQAFFQDKSVGFSPVVQDAQSQAYQDLLMIYDQARLRYEKGLTVEEEELEGDIRKWLEAVAARVAERSTHAGIGTENDNAKFLLKNVVSADQLVPFSKEEFAGQQRQDGLAAGANAAADQSVSAPVNQPPPMVRHFPMQQQQQILNQLSLAVARGMRSGEQHLVLKLHPADLGEVKVDLTVRQQVVSVSFTMENSKVKETLEGSMEEFRQNMEQKGFSLGDVNVFVGQNDEEQGGWQRFEAALSGERLQAQSLADLSDEVLYLTAQNKQDISPESGVNLFV